MTSRSTLVLLCALSVGSCGGESQSAPPAPGGSDGGGDEGGRPAGLPSSDSAADIGAFIRAGGYRAAPWIADVPSPRAGRVGTQHGDNVRVWLNATLVDSLRAGRNGQKGSPFPHPWSMAVKELYDSAGEKVGVTAALKTTAAPNASAWVYFCYAPGTRCLADRTGTESMPIYGRGSVAPTSDCATCHGATIFTPPPPP